MLCLRTDHTYRPSPAISRRNAKFQNLPMQRSHSLSQPTLFPKKGVEIDAKLQAIASETGPANVLF